MVPSLIVAFTWILSLFAVVWMTRPPPDPEPRLNRRQRRFLHRRRRRRSPWGRSGSIRDHGFHRSYPLRHRSAGYYVRMTASNAEIVRRLQHINNIASSLESLLSGIDACPSIIRTARREGESPERWWKASYYPVANVEVKVSIIVIKLSMVKTYLTQPRIVANLPKLLLGILLFGFSVVELTVDPCLK